MSNLFSPGVPHIDFSPREEEIPEKRETFEAQVLVITKARKEMVYPTLMLQWQPFVETTRVLRSGKYHAEFVQSDIANGKPTLIIYEDE